MIMAKKKKQKKKKQKQHGWRPNMQFGILEPDLNEFLSANAILNNTKNATDCIINFKGNKKRVNKLNRKLSQFLFAGLEMTAFVISQICD